MPWAEPICPFCAMGCTWRVGRDAGRAIHGEASEPTLEYGASRGPNHGALCAKGNMALELTRHPARLESPALREDGRLRDAGWEEAIAAVAGRLDAIRTTRGGGAVGLLLGPQLTVEETAAAIRLARALGTANVDLCEPGDHAALAGLAYAGARPAPVAGIEEIATASSLLVVGDMFSLAPCLAKPVLDARYRNRRHTLAVLSSTRNRTAWFARQPLLCRPAAEAAALTLILALALERAGASAPVWAAEARRHLARWTIVELEAAAGIRAAQAIPVVEALAGDGGAAVLLASEFGASERLDLVSGLAALVAEATGSRFLAMLEGADAHGIRATLTAAGYPGGGGLTTPELLEAAVRGDVAALLVFGCDPIAAFPGTIAAQAMRDAALVVVSAALPGPAVAAADVVFPAAVFGEKAGTVIGAFGATAPLEPALEPPGRALPDLDILQAIAAALPETAVPASAGKDPPADDTAHGFFAELDLFLRTAERAAGAPSAGSHLLLAEASATNAAEGSLTRQLSWARYAYPEALLGISATHAAALGVRPGDRVRLRSNWGETVLKVRVDGGLPAGVVTAPHRDPAVRALLRWRREPTLRCLDLRPDHVSLERVTEVERA